MSTVSQSLESATIALPLVAPPRMTEDEFVAWCKPHSNAEWVDGEVVVMSPVSRDHSGINGWLFALLRFFVEHFNLGEVHGPQMQVRFAGQRRRREPDIIYVATAHSDRLRSNHVEGAPDLAVEIVSPDSVARDWREKYLEYEAAGVAEYWIIDPLTQNVEWHSLDSAGKYSRIEPVDGVLASKVLSSFHIRVEWLWSKPLPKLTDVLKELGITVP